MSDETLILDAYRGPIAQQQVKVRRRRQRQANMRTCDSDDLAERFDRYVSAPYSETWHEPATAAVFLLRLYAMTDEAQEPMRRRLIAKTIEDLAQLSDSDTT